MVTTVHISGYSTARGVLCACVFLVRIREGYEGIHITTQRVQTHSLVPRPLPDFISQPWLQDKIWEWPGDEANKPIHPQKPMVQLTCTMIQLANVSQTVGGPLATAKALVVLGNHAPYGVWKDERLCQGVWRIDTVAVPFIHPCIMVQYTILTRNYASFDYKPPLLFAKVFRGSIFICNLCLPCPYMANLQ